MFIGIYQPNCATCYYSEDNTIEGVINDISQQHGDSIHASEIIFYTATAINVKEEIKYIIE